MLVQVRCRRDGARQRWPLGGPGGVGGLGVDVGMIAAEGRAGRLGGSWRALGGRCVRHSVGFVGTREAERTDGEGQGVKFAGALGG